MSELKPCPFCGSEAVLCPRAMPSSIRFQVMCDWQGCETKGLVYGCEAEAIDAWNTRIEEPSHPEPERAVVDDLAAANAEIERLRGLLIDPGSPAWEDARAILAAELRKSGFKGAAKQVLEDEGCNIPSHIALNLIGLAYKQSEVG